MVRKEYDTLFSLGAKDNGYSATFSKAHQQLVIMQKEINTLMKLQSDISAYQKQQAAVEGTNKKLEVLQQQYENIKKEMEEAGTYSSALENKLLDKQRQIDKTNDSLETQTQKLNQLGNALNEAGVDTGNLSGASADLKVKIDDIKEAQEEAAEKAQKFGSATTQAFDAIQQSVVAVGLAKTLKEIYKEFQECAGAAMTFEAAMSDIRATTGYTVEEMKSIEEGVKAVSLGTGKSINELSKDAKMLVEAGGDIDLMMGQMVHGGNLAIATNTDWGQTYDFLSAAMKTFKLDVKESKNVVDSFARTTTLTNLELAQIADAYVNVSGSASKAGFSISDVNAILITMSEAGLKGGAAGTSLNGVLRNLVTPTDKAAGALNELNVELYDNNGASRDMFHIMGDLEQALSGLNDEHRKRYESVIFDSVSQKGWNMIVADGIGSVAELSTQLDGSSKAFNGMGQAAGMAAVATDNALSKQKLMQNAAENFKVAIGAAYTPTLKEAYSVGADVLSGMTSFVEKNPELVRAVTASTAVIMLGTGALSSYGLAVKVIIPQLKILRAAMLALPGTKAIMAVTVAVTLLAGAVAAFSGKSKEASEDVNSLTSASRDQYYQLQALNKEYEAAKKAYGESSEEARKLKSEIVSLTAVYESNKQTLEDYTEEKLASAEASAELLKAHQKAVAEDNSQAEYETYIALSEKVNELRLEEADALIKMEKAQERYNTAAKVVQNTQGGNQLMLREMKAAKAELDATTEAYEALRGIIEEAKDATDNYSGATEDANKGNVELQSALAGTRSQLDTLSEAYKESYEAAYKSIEGQYALWDKAEKAVATSAGTITSALESQMSYWKDYNANLLSLGDRTSEIDGLQEVIASFADGSKDSVNTIAGFAVASDAELRKIVEIYKKVQGEEKAVSESLASVVSDFPNKMNEIQKKLEDAIVEMDLGDEAIKAGAKTIQGFIDGAESMEKDVYAAYSKIGQVGFNALSKHNSFVLEYSSAGYRPYVDGSHAYGLDYVPFDGYIAELHKGERVLNAIEARQIIETLPTEGGKNTIQEFINAARMTPQVIVAYDEVSQAAMDAIDKRLKIHSPLQEVEWRAEMAWAEYIKKTHEMEPQVAAAMTGTAAHGMEAVTAESPLMAEHGTRGSLGISQIVISPHYDFGGMENPEQIEAVLTSNTDSIREIVLDVLSDVEADNERRGY